MTRLRKMSKTVWGLASRSVAAVVVAAFVAAAAAVVVPVVVAAVATIIVTAAVVVVVGGTAGARRAVVVVAAARSATGVAAVVRPRVVGAFIWAGYVRCRKCSLNERRSLPSLRFGGP